MNWLILFWLLVLSWWCIKLDGENVTHKHKIQDIFNKLNKIENPKYKFDTYNSKGQIIK